MLFLFSCLAFLILENKEKITLHNYNSDQMYGIGFLFSNFTKLMFFLREIAQNSCLIKIFIYAHILLMPKDRNGQLIYR